MSTTKARILVVDDEPVNRLLISNYLRGGDYQLVPACDGQDAWEHLTAEPRGFDVVLLDLMMPRMDGWEVLQRIKADPVMQVMPVVIQTALTSPQDIHRGIRAGAYYYLPKPYEKEMLCSVIGTAVQDFRRYRRMQEQLDRAGRMFGLMRRAEFEFRTPQEGRELARALAGACPDPSRVVVGLAELLVNAVEHGNLGIGYREKGRLIESAAMEEEVLRRLTLPEFRDRLVQVTYERRDEEIRIRIHDQGQGFDWGDFGQVDPTRVFDAHGRGIAVARIMSFDRLEFRHPGNEVIGVIRVDH